MKGKIGAVILAIVLIIGLGCVATLSVKVPAGYVAVQYSASGGIKDEVLTQGFHITSPMITTTLYTVGIEQSYLCADDKGDSEDDESFEASTKEGKAVVLDMTFTYQFDPEHVTDVFTKFKGQSGKEVLNSFIKPNIISWTKEVVATYKVSDIIGDQRAVLNDNLSEYLAEKFKPYNIIISNASLINISVDEETRKAINAKITAQQNAETQKINNQTDVDKATADATVKTTKAQADADATLIKAKAQAEANELLSNSLTPELIEQHKIEKWSGDVPVVSGSNSATIVDVNSLIDEEKNE